MIFWYTYRRKLLQYSINFCIPWQGYETYWSHLHFLYRSLIYLGQGLSLSSCDIRVWGFIFGNIDWISITKSFSKTLVHEWKFEINGGTKDKQVPYKLQAYLVYYHLFYLFIFNHRSDMPSQTIDFTSFTWMLSICFILCWLQELLDLGEAVGIQSRGLSDELISLLPTSKYKCGSFFSRKKSGER